MKIIRYDWENKFFILSLNKKLLAFDSFNRFSLSDKLFIKSTINTNRNIDFAKLISFNYILGGGKFFLNLSQNIDKNPLKLKLENKKSVNSIILLHKYNYISSMFYVYFLYLVNLFNSKNIKLSNTVKNIYNSQLNELNSILKIGYSYNVLDIDPSVDLNFSTINNKIFLKSLL